MPKGGESDFEDVRVGKTVEATEGANKVAAGQLKETLQAMYKGFQQGIMPKQMLNVGDDTLEGLYTQAYVLYNQGKFKDASFIFVMLGVMDPYKMKYQLGSAACMHKMGHYEKAGQIYLICSGLEPKNPLPHFHAADCYIKINALPLAEMCLKNAIECCGKNTEYEIIKERASLMLTAVKQELEVMLKNAAEEAAKEKDKEK